MDVTMLAIKNRRRGKIYKHRELVYNTIFRVKRSDGHLGCSRGYNSMEYKEHLPEGFYTQGREQTNSLLEKVSSSFRQMNYQRKALYRNV